MPIGSHEEQLKQIYNKYSKEFKPWLAAVEAKYEEFPAAILNEIRAYVDHISRCYMDSVPDQIIERNIDRAASHLDRAIFDCIKFLVVWFYEDVRNFENTTKNIDLSLIDSGKFYVAFRKLRGEAEDFVKRAKENEKIDRDLSYGIFQDAFNAYAQLSNLISDNLPHVDWAKRKRNKLRLLKVIAWFLTAVVSGIVSHLAANLLKGNLPKL